MSAELQWLDKNHEGIVRSLADLVAVKSISTDGEHRPEIERTAALTCQQMREAGLHNVEVLKVGDSLPYAYGEWLGAPGKPTVFLYAHHDVQPVNRVGDAKDDWKSDPWVLTRRDNRLFGRGAADDKGAIAAQLGAISAFLKARNSLPVNIKMVVEGEEEIGSKNLLSFFERHKSKIQSDVIVVCDTENIEVGLPCITYSLRGIVSVIVEVRSAATPVHSGMGGGYIADAAIALNKILSRLYWENGPLPIPDYYKSVRQMTDKERKSFKALPFDEGEWRRNLGIPNSVVNANEKGLGFYEQTWRKPAITVIAQEASSIKGASNQVLPRAMAIVSCRIVPDQDPQEVQQQITDFLSKDPPWGVQVSVQAAGARLQLVDDRSERPGVRGRDGGAPQRLRPRRRRHRLRRQHRLRRPPLRPARRRPRPAPRHRGSAQQRPRPQRKPARRRLQTPHGVPRAPVRKSRQTAGGPGEVKLDLIRPDAGNSR